MRKIFLLTSLFLCFCTQAFADNNSITIKSYYQSNCAAIAGTWGGYFTDPSDLYGNGGPWPITINFSVSNNQVTGKLVNANFPDYLKSAMKHEISAECQSGNLQNISFGNAKSFSKGGELISKNMMILFLQSGSAMMGTEFVVVLNRQNSK